MGRANVRCLTVLGILLVAAGLRCWRLGDEGVLLYDEGQMIREGRAYRDICRAWCSTGMHVAGAGRVLADTLEWSPICFARPFHNIAVALAGEVAPSDVAAALWVSALAGVATVAVVMLLAWRWYGADIGLGAAALLAVSPYHVIYSRSALADSLSVLLWIMGLGLCGSQGPGGTIISGVIAGLCLASNYRLLPLILLFPVVMFGTNLAGTMQPLRRSWLWLLAVACVLLCMELPFRLWEWEVRSTGTPVFPVAGTYLHQLRSLLGVHAKAGFAISGVWSFPYWLVMWDGWLSLLIGIMAALWHLRNARPWNRLVFIGVLSPMLAYSFLAFSAPRFFLAALPGLAIMSAHWLLRADGILRRVVVFVSPVGLVAAVSVPLLIRSLHLIPQASPYLLASNSLRAMGAVVHLSTNRNIGEAYFGPAGSWPIPPDQSELKTFRRAGVRYAVVDLQRDFNGYGLDEDRERMTVWIQSKCRVVREYAYSRTACIRFLSEQMRPFPETRAHIRQAKSQPSTLRIYDLSDLHGVRRAVKRESDEE